MSLAAVPTPLSDRVRRLVAPNPGLLTGAGTNTYLVGAGDEIVVIDPGPDDEDHLDRVVAAAGGAEVVLVLCTHTHADHAPGARGLVARTRAPVAAFVGRDGLAVDRTLADGDRLEVAGVTIDVLHTPGHASNHLCFHLLEDDLLFSGDHVLGGSTVVVAPPEGDMAAYLDQLERLRALDPATIAPGHGEVITDPRAVLDGYLAHRRRREASIVEAVGDGPTTIDALVARLYVDVDPALHPWAAASVWAHLDKLQAEGVVQGGGRGGTWALVNRHPAPG